MKFAPVFLASFALLSAADAFARDSSEKIPAPVLELRPAGTLPTAVAVVKSSPIPAPTVEVVPQAQATSSYENYNVDARGTTQMDYSRNPSVNVVR